MVDCYTLRWQSTQVVFLFTFLQNCKKSSSTRTVTYMQSLLNSTDSGSDVKRRHFYDKVTSSCDVASLRIQEFIFLESVSKKKNAICVRPG